LAIALLLLGLGQSTASYAKTDSLADQRQLFLSAEQSLRHGAIGRYQRQRKQLDDYPLAGYLDYRYLKGRLRQARTSQIKTFLKENADSPISRSLRKRWLLQLAHHGQWQAFLDNYQDLASTSLACYRVRALFHTGQDDEALKVIPALWLSGRSQPSACDRVFAEWEKRGKLTTEMIWARIRLAMQARKLSLARFLAHKLNTADQQWVALWRRMHRRPAQTLENKKLRQDIPIAREIVLHGIKRLSRLDASKAIEAWQPIKSRYTFSNKDKQETLRALALRAAYQNLPQAHDLLMSVSQDYINDRVAEWRIRTAIAHQNWAAVVRNVNALPAEQRNDERWQYWHARALRALGYKKPAEQLFSTLSQERSYYGFLSAETISAPYKMNDEAIPYTQGELQQLKQMPAMQRASELYTLGRIVPARREWNHMINRLPQRKLELAGVIAHKWGWHDRAILTIGRTTHRSDLSLRYPIVFKKQIMKNARRQNIAPAWVYSVLRQESAFMRDARSSAGAMGLMQLMPSTARTTARKLSLSFRPNRDLLDANKNIRLGTAHLKEVLDNNKGHFVLATASYNAGLYRVKSWLPEKHRESADVWIEAMPFTETRNYVQRILATTAIFEKRLGEPVTPLSKRMRDIQPASK
jgi:soluble lytic murein transglycosylase